MVGTKRSRSTQSTLLTVLLLGALALSPAPAFAQETGFVSDTEYVLTYGATLAWDDPWVADQEASGFTMDQLGDYLVFEAGSNAYMQFSTFPAIGDLPSTIERVAGLVAGTSGEVLATESDKQRGHALVVIEQGVSTFAALVADFRTDDLATEQVMVLMTEAIEIGEWISSVQDTFTLDGEPILQDIDAREMQDTVDAATDPGGSDGNDSDDKKLPEEPNADEPAGDDGLTGDRSYESPQFGTTIDWNQRWIADDTLVDSDTVAEVDYLALNRRGGDSTLYISLRDAASMSPEAWLAWFEDDIGSAAELDILDSDGDADGVWVMYEREVEGTTVYGYAGAYVAEGDVLTVVELAGPANEREFAQVFDAAQTSVEIDGAPPFTLTDEAPVWP